LTDFLKTILIFPIGSDEKTYGNNKDSLISKVNKWKHSPDSYESSVKNNRDNSDIQDMHLESKGHLSFQGPTSHGLAKAALTGFTLKSEYFEKNIQIDSELNEKIQQSSDSEDITSIKVYKKNGIEEVAPESLKSYIESNLDISKVVIEKIGVEDASRVSLLFEPNENKAKLSLVEKDEQLVQRQYELSDLEDQMNDDFLMGNLGPSKQKDQKQARVTLGLKSEENELSLESNTLFPDEKQTPNSSVEKSLSYEKHSLTRKQKKRSRKSAHYYYRVQDHMELFKVGSSYLRDFKSGIRSMGFSSYQLSRENQKTVFGLTSFFNYHDDLNICIITDKMKNSFYDEILKNKELRSDIYSDENVEYNFIHCEGHDFIEYSELTVLSHHCEHLEDFISFLLEKYDLILWDLPDLKVMNRYREVFFPIVQSIESLTLIMAAEVSRGKELDSLLSYFQKYQVPVKGVLFKEEVSAKRKTKREVTDGAA
tara:strand:+ start:88786 stop:90231 length:1446 start_codon:yes stop_codon:yes gene_type:complete